MRLAGTYDILGHICEISGHIYETIGHIYEITGHIYEITGHIYEIVGHIYEITGYIYTDIALKIRYLRFQKREKNKDKTRRLYMTLPSEIFILIYRGFQLLPGRYWAFFVNLLSRFYPPLYARGGGVFWRRIGPNNSDFMKNTPAT